MKKERIQKVLANIGLASRRKIESWIVEGRIMVNGKRAELGQCISLKDNVTFNGKRIFFEKRMPEKKRLIMYNKPVGLICTRDDPEGRSTVFDDLPPIQQGRWIHIGRLDLNTSGLMLFTNDGELANRLTHPSSHIEREYAVRIHGRVTPEITKKLVNGVALEDGRARFEDIVEAGGEGENQWFYVVVAEGRNRLVRRLWESQGLDVSKLKRVRFGPVILPKSLRRGAWMELDPEVFQ